jgi:hypothetical protein
MECFRPASAVPSSETLGYFVLTICETDSTEDLLRSSTPLRVRLSGFCSEVGPTAKEGLDGGYQFSADARF